MTETDPIRPVIVDRLSELDWLNDVVNRSRGHQVTAAEKAMQDIGAALEEFYKSNITEWDFLNTVARVNGAYSVERIGEGEG